MHFVPLWHREEVHCINARVEEGEKREAEIHVKNRLLQREIGERKRIEAGKLEMETLDFDLRSMLVDMTDLLAMRHNLKKRDPDI